MKILGYPWTIRTRLSLLYAGAFFLAGVAMIVVIYLALGQVLDRQFIVRLENGEMELNYQPVVSAVTEEVVSFEALVRWNSKVHGSVSPGKFVPIAEDTRLIFPIGTWVL